MYPKNYPLMQEVKKPTTVTIGIPAHNEEANIERLLTNLLSQKLGAHAALKRIIVAADGCTDLTEDLVTAYSYRDPRVELLADGERKGKCGRMNDFFRMNNSTVLVILDGDIDLADEATLAQLIAPLSSPDVAIVGGNARALWGESFLERVLAARDAYWYEARRQFRDGENHYNAIGCTFAFSREFARNFAFHTGAIHDHFILFLATRHLGRRFVFAEDARVHFLEASNWKELIDRARRSAYHDDLTSYHFTFETMLVPQLSLAEKLRSFWKTLPAKHFYLLLSPFLTLAIKLTLLYSQKADPLLKSGLWQITESSKKLS